MNQRAPTANSYESVKIFYLAVGGLGLLFVAGSILSQYGWLESLIEAIFGDRSESVLQSIYGFGILLTFALGFFLFVGWIPAIWIVLRFRSEWLVWGPSAFFLVIEILVLVSLQSDWAEESSFEWVIGTLVGLYFLGTLLAGLNIHRAHNSSSPSEDFSKR